MRYSKIFPKTRRDDPKDAPSPGTRLLIRAGFIEQIAGGIWVVASLGLMVRRAVENIVREEMERTGALEVELPILQPKELWEETGRWRKYLDARIAFHLKDRKGAEFILAPTAEEVITHFTRNNLFSYREFPVTFWQMGPKFRDEFRPRQGMIRGREFIMKDAYSFDVDEAGMKLSYRTMEEAYKRIFDRIGFELIEVEADSGAIGGSGSAEFMAVTAYGEDVLLYCPQCHYGGNQEKASAYFPPYPDEPLQPLQELATPGIKTVEGLEKISGLKAAQMVKTIVMSADGKPVIVCMRGDLEISKVKLANLMHAADVDTATHDIVEEVTKAPVGFAGPIGLFGKTNVPFYFDKSVEGIKNFLCGANKLDVHFIGVNEGRDFPAPGAYVDLANATAGSHCPNCKSGLLEAKKGIELGHIFQLQQAYSKPMQTGYLAESNNKEICWMGCYGIGVSRIVQAIVEQCHDERGIVWPFSIAPFQAIVIPANFERDMADSEEVYRRLQEEHFHVLWDDRDARIGEKFTDAELLGIPLQIVVGRSWHKDKKLELRWRNCHKFDTQVFRQAKPNSLPSCELDYDATVGYIRRIRGAKK